MRGDDPDLLIGDHFDGALDDDGRRRLEAWLLADPGNRQRFLRQVMEHRELFRLAAGQARPAPPRRAPPPRRERRPWPALAAAAVLAVALAAWWMPADRRAATSDQPPVASGQAPAVDDLRPEVVAASAADAAPGRRVAPGEQVGCGDGGSLTLRWRDGTTVTLASGSAIAAGSGVGVHLLHGRISAEVAPQPPGQPAVFTTPEAEVTVVGTALAVASAAGEAAVEVSHGRVRARRLADGAEVVVDAGTCAAIAPGLALRARPQGSAAGRTFRVLPGEALPGEAGPGDVVEFAPGIHRGAWRWTRSGTPLRPLVLRGAGTTRPLLDAGSVDDLRAVLQIDASDVVVEHLDLAGARNGANAAGIRLAGGADRVVIRDCRIHGNDQGVEADPGSGTLTIADCEIDGNGARERPGYCHNLNLAGRHARIRGCRIGGAAQGVDLMLRGGGAELVGNRLGGGADGEIALEPPAGGGMRLVLRGNLIVGGARAEGWNHSRFISLARGGGEVAISLDHDTLVAGDPRNLLIAAAGARVRLDDCILAGTSRLAGPGTVLAGARDWLPAGAEPAGLEQVAGAGDPGFADPAAGDFRLRPGSPCRGRAGGEATGVDLEPPGPEGPARPRPTASDLGAYAGG